MTMKFDKLCTLVLEAKNKKVKFGNLVLGNEDPIFTEKDIAFPPGVTSPDGRPNRLYLTKHLAKVQGRELSDPQNTVDDLRRVNWVAHAVIRQARRATKKGRTLSLEQTRQFINDALTRYQELILSKAYKWGSAKSADTGWETRVIGNLLLPPTKGEPNGKSVLIVPGMDPAAGPEEEKTRPSGQMPAGETGGTIAPPRAPRTPRVPREPKNTEPSISLATPDEPISNETMPDLAVGYASAYELQDQWNRYMTIFNDMAITQKIISVAERGGRAREVLADPEFNDDFTKNVLRIKLKNMLRSGELIRTPEGGLAVGKIGETDPVVAQQMLRLKGLKKNPATGKWDIKALDDVEEEEETELSADVKKQEDDVKEISDEHQADVEVEDEEDKDIKEIPDNPSWDKEEKDPDLPPDDEEDEDEEDDWSK